MEAKVEAFRTELHTKSLEELIEIAVSLFREKNGYANRLEEYGNSSHEMALQFQQMKNELEGARKEIRILREQNLHLTGVNKLRTKDLFGRSTEKASDILERGLDGDREKDPLDEDETGVEGGTDNGQATGCTSDPSGKIRRKGHSGGEGKKGKKKTKGKRDDDIKDLPKRVVFEYNTDELDGMYGEGNWRFAFWEMHRTVEKIRPATYLQITYTPVISYESAYLEHCLARIPYEAVLPKTLASASLLSSIIVDKYSLFLPLYRQEHDEDRFGFPLSRRTMSNWICRASSELLEPIYHYLCDLLRESFYQQCDETPYMVIRDGRKAGAKSYIWIHRTSELAPGPEIIVYCYEKTRDAGHLRDFYAGLDHKIYLTSDAYGAYQSLALETDGMVVNCGCFMHSRRRFVEALNILDIKGMSEEEISQLPEMQAIDLIGKIYEADEKMKGHSTEERLETRRSDACRATDDFYEFVEGFDLNDPLASDKLKDAIQYARNQKECLLRFLEDGNIPLDNGACERDVRSVALIRRNSLFSNTIKGAQATVVASTLVRTAKANGADPYYYIKYLLEKMPRHLGDTCREYLSDMVPWCDAYKTYEARQKEELLTWVVPPGNEKPSSPRKNLIKKAG